MLDLHKRGIVPKQHLASKNECAATVLLLRKELAEFMESNCNHKWERKTKRADGDSVEELLDAADFGPENRERHQAGSCSDVMNAKQCLTNTREFPTQHSSAHGSTFTASRFKVLLVHHAVADIARIPDLTIAIDGTSFSKPE